MKLVIEVNDKIANKFINFDTITACLLQDGLKCQSEDIKVDKCEGGLEYLELAEITLAMRHLNITEGYMTEEQLKVAEKHALKLYRQRQCGK